MIKVRDSFFPYTIPKSVINFGFIYDENSNKFFGDLFLKLKLDFQENNTF